MKYILALVLLTAQYCFAQQTKEDKKIEDGVKKTIGYLADDKLEGRRTGTPGEKLAYEYIEKQFEKAGLKTFTADNSYIQPFDVNDGKEIKTALFSVNGSPAKLNEDFFPLAYSADADRLLVKGVKTSGLFTYDVEKMLFVNKDNPHFDLKQDVYDRAKSAQVAGATIFLIFNNDFSKNGLGFEKNDRSEKLKIPVICITNNVLKNVSASEMDNINLNVSIDIRESHRTGHNVIGYINNDAANTIILGAHYDHLGYGEDHNSLYAGNPPMIHNGADDNASGTAALIELGKWLKNSSYKKYNYLLVSFSGEELGLFGSKYFTDHANLDLKTVNYMINMDMVGRLNDSTHGLTIGGYGTSPSWGTLIDKKDVFFKLNLDSSGSGPSDHTSFYRKDIPVLFFFTGSHKDYHKPSDDADKINYDGELEVIHYIQGVIAKTDRADKLVFTKTRDAATGKNTFKVSLGIMPDYTFSDPGVRVDGVSDNRPAQKAGIKTGDVLIQLGDHKFTDVQTYMDALNHFNKGESTVVKLKRGTEELTLPITF